MRYVVNLIGILNVLRLMVLQQRFQLRKLIFDFSYFAVDIQGDCAFVHPLNDNILVSVYRRHNLRKISVVDFFNVVNFICMLMEGFPFGSIFFYFFFYWCLCLLQIVHFL